MLKAFFDETQIMTNCVTASADGATLVPYYDEALTVGGEIDKLAFNVADGQRLRGNSLAKRRGSRDETRRRRGLLLMLQDLVIPSFAETHTGWYAGLFSC